MKKKESTKGFPKTEILLTACTRVALVADIGTTRKDMNEICLDGHPDVLVFAGDFNQEDKARVEKALYLSRHRITIKVEIRTTRFRNKEDERMALCNILKPLLRGCEQKINVVFDNQSDFYFFCKTIKESFGFSLTQIEIGSLCADSVLCMSNEDVYLREYVKTPKIISE